MADEYLKGVVTYRLTKLRILQVGAPKVGTRVWASSDCQELRKVTKCEPSRKGWKALPEIVTAGYAKGRTLIIYIVE